MKRDSSIDIFRGLIILIMALDHASYFVIQTHFYEGYDFVSTYPNFLAFITRWISHLCAPGFFFVLGYGAYKRYYKAKIEKYKMFARSIILILLQLSIINYVWDNDFIYFGVITALALTLLLITLIMPLMKKYGLIIGLLSIVFSQVAINNQAILNSSSLITRFILVPGVYKDSYVLYVVLPWFGLACLGAYLSGKKNAPYFKLSTFGFMLFFMVQFIYLDKPLTIIEGLTIVKYPPSIAFLSVTMAINFLLIGLIKKIAENKLLVFLKTYGKSSLFFYITHLYLYAFIGRFTESNTYSTLYLSWILGIVLLYYPCKYYLIMKRRLISAIACRNTPL